MDKRVQHFIPGSRHFYLAAAPLAAVSDQPEMTARFGFGPPICRVDSEDFSVRKPHRQEQA
jgi:hypothetical protein